ncbi:1-phosphatidylinositol phosphodiesterase [Pseudomonas sp. GGS8]|uniref:phosphatidylinositol-specific phospholipase C domain-containing protein n=1 Tax=Pseudomonas sp. GGS8 TaxID=2817892 RepID=UPI0020A0C204|nr:phosphatidylinositol-specific phospholipase C domain-containing protein [Pseudomonas sp. GGS8]MCP1445671.1 1-phosphatidylinositol phosphodiesterase [Pseudomonas sp. GGS8]
MDNVIQHNYAFRNWMAAAPAIDTLSLAELTLPGTHNAGSDWKASWPLIPGAHWLACQHESFYSQLRHGSRVLDIRLTYDASAPGLGKFCIHHNGYRNGRTFGHLVNDVETFLQENPNEFIILDFHELHGDSFDYAYFNKMVVHFLGRRLIPNQNRSLSIGQLKRLSGSQRVVVAAPWHWAIDKNVFIQQIEHKWSGNGITSAAELEQHIIKVLKYPPGTWAPWSLSATSYSALGGPVDIHDELNSWFAPNKSDWATRCNIINVDFIEESNIVSYCLTANLSKAAKRAN